MFVSHELNDGTDVIDDSNAQNYVQQIADPNTPFTGGYSRRNYDSHPAGWACSTFSALQLPRSTWRDHIKRQDDEQSSPDHWRLRGEVPILDQNGLPYCWMYGTVGAIMTVYAQNGYKPTPRLSATGPAAQGKNWVKRGGWATEAIPYVERFGIPELNVWPEHSMNRRLPQQESVKRSAAMHSIVDFEELPRNNFNAMMSVLLDPVDPRPVTLGLNWWGHLVYGTKAIAMDGGRFGVKIVNSWRRTWGKDGCAVLTESKGTAYECVKIKRVTLRVDTK